MLDENTTARSKKLLEVFVAERAEPFALMLRRNDAEMAASGNFHSSNRILLMHRAFAFELRSRVAYAWQSLCRAHAMQGRPTSVSIREDLKGTLELRLQELHDVLESDLRERLEKGRVKMDVTLTAEAALAREKHYVEIDLYVDNMMTTESTKVPAQYNFYGAIGAVQTAEGSVANVVQNLAGGDREALLAALAGLRDLIREAVEIAEEEKAELAQITEDCTTELTAGRPNGLKLKSLLSTVGATVQTIASVQPAYVALKTAALAIGVVLP